MKQLYINDKRIVLGENIYLPFQQKIGTLDDITIQGIPTSKTIQIPRCPENDEVFGYLCEVTKNNISFLDSKIGISLNQIKRIPYTLYNDSEILSEGIVRILSVDEAGYEIELYDKLIDILETLDGDEETGTGWLNNYPIRLSTGISLNIAATSLNIKTMSDGFHEVRPCVNLKEWEYEGNKARVQIMSGSIQTVNLPTDLTPLQFQGLKPYDFEYACPVSTVIRSINYVNNIISYDSSLNSYFNALHYNLGSPKPVRVDSTNTFADITFPLTTGRDYYDPCDPILTRGSFYSGGTNQARDNGKYTLKFDLSGTFLVTEPTPAEVFGGGKSNGVYFNGYYYNAPSGTYLGSIWVGFSIAGRGGTSDNTTYIESQGNYVEVRLIKDVNCYFGVESGGIRSLTFSQSGVELSYDWYFDIYEQPTYITNYLHVLYDKLSILNQDNLCGMFAKWNSTSNYWEGVEYEFTPVITSCSIRRQYNEFRTGDYLNGSTLFPKVSIKEWLLSLAKYHNYKLELKDGKIHISPKTYVESTEVLLLEEEPVLEVSNLDFSRLVLSSGVGRDEDVQKYEQEEKIPWGAQVINTGYTIKKQKKEIKFPLSLPILKTDYNGWGYGEFGGYYNGGYSRINYGMTKEGGDFVFGFINHKYDNLWVVPDTPWEANMKEGIYIPTSKEWIHVNRKLIYDTGTRQFIFPLSDTSFNERMTESRHTLSPYQFSGNTIVTSLEMNKPRYNLAGIQDSNYSETVTQYWRVWREKIIDMYNSNTHKLRARVFINGTFNPYAVYNIKNSLYIPLEIEEYDPTSPGIYPVTFLRVNDINNYI